MISSEKSSFAFDTSAKLSLRGHWTLARSVIVPQQHCESNIVAMRSESCGTHYFYSTTVVPLCDICAPLLPVPAQARIRGEHP
jgi:hypothetical protein